MDNNNKAAVELPVWMRVLSASSGEGRSSNNDDTSYAKQRLSSALKRRDSVVIMVEGKPVRISKIAGSYSVEPIAKAKFVLK